MNERDVTMTICAHCDQPVQPSLHTTVQCLDNMRAQRDEARSIAQQTLEAQLQGRVAVWNLVLYPWLKQTSVDEEEG